MYPKRFSFLLGLGTVFAWIGWLRVWWRINPTEAGWLGIGLFYVSAALSLTGTFFFIGKFFRTKLGSKQLLSITFAAALRQGILFTLLVIGWLALNSQRMASLWNLVLLLLVLTACEFFFMSRHQHARPTVTL